MSKIVSWYQKLEAEQAEKDKEEEKKEEGGEEDPLAGLGA